VTVGSQAINLVVTGTGFVSGSNVLWSGAVISTTYVSSTQLDATVPQNLLAVSGNATITVESPSGVISNAETFIVSPVGAGSSTGGLAHYAVGSNFTTGIFVINTGGTVAQYSISFFNDNGVSSFLPFSTGTTNQLSGTLPPYGSLYVEATNPNGPLTAGWGQISADTSIVIQSLFRSTLNNTEYEAAVPSSTGDREFELPFDLTNFSPGVPLYTGIAVANLDTVNTANITCTARDQSGNIIPNGITIPSLVPLGHFSGYQFPNLTGLKGTIDCTSTTEVAVVALRFIGTNTFSSLPVIKKQ
jgi:hypothetical protein